VKIALATCLASTGAGFLFTRWIEDGLWAQLCLLVTQMVYLASVVWIYRSIAKGSKQVREFRKLPSPPPMVLPEGTELRFARDLAPWRAAHELRLMPFGIYSGRCIRGDQHVVAIGSADELEVRLPDGQERAN
jgi:hypothetical protein